MNPFSRHPVLDPNPDKGQRLKRAGLDHTPWTDEDDARFAQLVQSVRRCPHCGGFLGSGCNTIRVLPLDDPDWPMITFESTKRCHKCGATVTEYT